MSSRTVRIALVLAVLAWVGLIFLAPLSQNWGWSASGWLYLFFHQICHQIPERSFSVAGHPLAVCHRCLGIYLGFGVGSLLLGLRLRLWRLLQDRPRLLALFWIPMVLDVLLPNVWWSRFSTGWLAGFPVSLFVMLALQQLLSAADPADSRKRAIENY